MSVWYGGRCRDVYEDGVCGLHMPGMRLFAGPDGNGTCDCDTGEARQDNYRATSLIVTCGRAGSGRMEGATKSSLLPSVKMEKY